MFKWWVFLALIGGGALMAQPKVDKDQIIDVLWEEDSTFSQIVYDSKLYEEYWDTIPQLKFWRIVMNTPPEISFVNIAATREILDTVVSKRYDRLTYHQKRAFKEKIVTAHNLPLGTGIYVTTGKNDYYKHEDVLSDINKAVKEFRFEGVDPWYAQAILLIESPGKLRKSYVGAYGPFQLMRYVAITNGLTVTRALDERADVIKAAGATARFIRRVCLPETRQILDAWRLDYDESSIWFRLMVLHVYHAGAGNVRGALRNIAPKEGGIQLIQQLWQTRYRGFGNASQNYSQLALASLMELNDIVAIKGKLKCKIIPRLTKIKLPETTRIPLVVPAAPTLSVGNDDWVFQP